MTESRIHTQRKSGSRVGVSQFQISDIQPFFIYPLHEAATKLNISPSFLKKLCRRFGVMRWPFRTLRKIQGNDNLISSHNKMSHLTGTFYVSSPKDQQKSTKEPKQKPKKRDFVWVPFKGDKKLRTLMSKPDSAHLPPLAPLSLVSNNNNTVQLVEKEMALPPTVTSGATVKLETSCNSPDLRPAVSSPQTNSSSPPPPLNNYGSWTCTHVIETNSPDSSNYMHTHSNAMSLDDSSDDSTNNDDNNNNNNTSSSSSNSMLVFSQEFRFNRNPAWDFVLNVEDLSKFHTQPAPPLCAETLPQSSSDVFCLNLDLTPFYLL